MTWLMHIPADIMNWVHHLTGWQATVVVVVLACHDFILWPVMFALGAVTGRKVKAPKRIRK